MIDIKVLDQKIQHGYLLILENQACDGCDEWLQAWEDIKQLMIETNSKDLYELDKKYTWSESGSPSEFVEDIKYELHAAGVKDQVYQNKYNAYCQELACYIGIGAPADRNKRFKLKNGFSLYEMTDAELAKHFVKKEPMPLIMKQAKTGRNEPCPCGSGRKYKKCCGAKMVG